MGSFTLIPFSWWQEKDSSTWKQAWTLGTWKNECQFIVSAKTWCSVRSCWFSNPHQQPKAFPLPITYLLLILNSLRPDVFVHSSGLYKQISFHVLHWVQHVEMLWIFQSIRGVLTASQIAAVSRQRLVHKWYQDIKIPEVHVWKDT